MSLTPQPDHGYARERDAIRAERLKQPTTILPGEESVTIPPSDEAWHPTIQRMWGALVVSPHAAVFTSIDWEMARFTFGEANAYLTGGYTSGGRQRGRSAIALQTIYAMLKDYVLPPAERVRLRIAIQAPEPPAPRELSMDELRDEIAKARGVTSE
ncbi:hypothetical protein [Micromonospora sp. NPDC049891]|uniref:phage terminase small subunit n=1 Tax=Micromonospora sp. NPDC049891 TaxID=3155655 RepID=UPI003407FC68